MLGVKQAFSPSPTPTCRQGIFVRHIPPPPEMLFPASYVFSLSHSCCINEGGLAFGQGTGWLFCAGVKRARKASVFSLVPAVPIFYSDCVKLSFFMFYGSGVFGIAFSFPVCLRYKLLGVRNWAYYDRFLLGESVQLALLFVGEGFWDVYSV